MRRMGYIHIDYRKIICYASCGRKEQTMKNYELEIAWLAGYLEGEGCFYVTKLNSVGITVTSTDEDIVDRVASMFGREKRGPKFGKPARKPYFTVGVHSDRAVKIMNEILPYMGERRSEKIKEILSRRESGKGKNWSLGSSRRTICHPEKSHYAFGLCAACYKKKVRSEKKLGVFNSTIRKNKKLYDAKWLEQQFKTKTVDQIAAEQGCTRRTVYLAREKNLSEKEN